MADTLRGPRRANCKKVEDGMYAIFEAGPFEARRFVCVPNRRRWRWKASGVSGRPEYMHADRDRHWDGGGSACRPAGR
jgi:hypothetical protein